MTNSMKVRALAADTLTFEQLASQFETNKKQLYRPDGAKRYGDQEHAERMASLIQPVQTEAAEVKKATAAAIAEAKQMRVVKHADPLSSLSDSELQRAFYSKPFIEDSVNAMPLTELADRLAAVVATGTKGEQACYYQAAHKRTEALKEASRGKATLDGVSGGNSTVNLEGISDVTQHLQTLATKLIDPKHAQVLAEADELERMAIKISMTTTEKLRELDGSHALAQQTVTDFYRANF